jgi:hypothetical protein
MSAAGIGFALVAAVLGYAWWGGQCGQATDCSTCSSGARLTLGAKSLGCTWSDGACKLALSTGTSTCDIPPIDGPTDDGTTTVPTGASTETGGDGSDSSCGDPSSDDCLPTEVMYPDWYTIRNVGTGECLYLPNPGSVTSGNRQNLLLGKCNKDNERFQFAFFPGEKYGGTIIDSMYVRNRTFWGWMAAEQDNNMMMVKTPLGKEGSLNPRQAASMRDATMVMHRTADSKLLPLSRSGARLSSTVWFTCPWTGDRCPRSGDGARPWWHDSGGSGVSCGSDPSTLWKLEPVVEPE